MSLCPVSFKKPFFINIYSAGHKGSCCSACSVCIVVVVASGFSWLVYRKRVAETWPALPSFKISNKFNMFCASVPRHRDCENAFRVCRGVLLDDHREDGMGGKCGTDARSVGRREGLHFRTTKHAVHTNDPNTFHSTILRPLVWPKWQNHAPVNGVIVIYRSHFEDRYPHNS